MYSKAVRIQVLFCLFAAETLFAQYSTFVPGVEKWSDNNGIHINAHGGGILFHEDKYYWFGEHREKGFSIAKVGVHCYSSSDLYNWTDEGIALSVVDDKRSPIVRGCLIERPKVIYNECTGQFVMYFHHEIKGKGYEAAQVGVAVSDKPAGPYRFVKAGRVNAKKWPLNMSEEQKNAKALLKDFDDWWTPEWSDAVKNGMFVRRDFKGGQMSRDMTLFVDDDKKAYHIYSSEENLTLNIAELTDDYLDYTGRYIRVDAGGHNEAPSIFKKDGKYYMITSGCTGWASNAARLHIADEMLGEWKRYPNPCVGESANITFDSQSTYILSVQGKKNAFIFMSDHWVPKSLIDSRHIWLPILFENGMPVLKWYDEWDLSLFDTLNPDSRSGGGRQFIN